MKSNSDKILLLIIYQALTLFNNYILQCCPFEYGKISKTSDLFISATNRNCYEHRFLVFSYFARAILCCCDLLQQKEF